ncbi:MAG: hypothetical protein OXJ37_10860 [Bryobacterales bacterium]|nr:hypothetical protein [Bryobacterales bacterium]MDE0621910.1 hypothetical protein [Bryobacterales bacterium]MYB54692.1 hypothetical protein [Terriglobia bacterium]
MATITVRRLDASVIRRLKARAEINGRSLEGEVRQILGAAVDNDMEAKRRAFVLLSERLRKEIPNRSQKSSADLIREDRDRDHRS